MHDPTGFIIRENLKTIAIQAHDCIFITLQSYDIGFSKDLCKSTKPAVIVVLIMQYVVVYSYILCFPETEEVAQGSVTKCSKGWECLP